MDSRYALPVTPGHHHAPARLGINTSTSHFSYNDSPHTETPPSGRPDAAQRQHKYARTSQAFVSSPLASALSTPTSHKPAPAHLQSLSSNVIDSPPQSVRNSLVGADIDDFADGNRINLTPAHSSSHSHSCSHSGTNAHTHSHSHGQSLQPHIHDHSHSHSHSKSHTHMHHHPHLLASTSEGRSTISNLLIPYTESSPLFHSIMIEKDSRRLLYFMSLNFCFMLVQAFYGYVTDSLGLLSDSIHMFFDCLALAMGLFAAVSSKWPPSSRFPYGFSKIESLSGFGNGVFLILISIEILIEAIERLAEGRETKRLNELLVVSSMGLAVNLVGMMAFGHHHHGHSHGAGGCSHTHDHADSDHSHTATPIKSGSQTPLYDHDHKHSNSISEPITPMGASLVGGHNHDHENQNMAGIYLHILADTMGSAAVIVSTLLMQFVGWSGWDPLASCIIAILIFLSSLPLVSSSAKQLLLTVPADTEYKLRNTLSEVSSLRGVASYSVPKFWMAEGFEDSKDQVMGVIHLVAIKEADSEDVRQRARQYLAEHGMDVVVQVDREGEGKCWCGGDGTRTPSSSTGSRFI